MQVKGEEQVEIEEPRAEPVHPTSFADHWNDYTKDELKWGLVTEELFELPKELLPVYHSNHVEFVDINFKTITQVNQFKKELQSKGWSAAGKKRMVASLFTHSSETIKEVAELIRLFPLAKCVIYDQRGYIESEEVLLSKQELVEKYLGKEIAATILPDM